MDRLEREYLEIIRNNFVIADTKNNPITKSSCELLYNKFMELNIDYFYKFKSLDSEYTLSNLKDDIFHFTLIDNLNDPFEYSYKIDISEERRRRSEILKHVMFIEEPTEAELNDFLNTDAYKMMESIREYVLVYSLTTTYDNAPMWAAYGNEYNGICIEYDAIDLFGKYSWRLSPIEYVDSIPQTPYRGSQADILKFIHRTCVAKDKKWKNEKEWRITSIQFADKKKDRDDIIQPTGIILGYNVSAENEKKIYDLCECKNIRLYKIELDKESYELKRKRVL